MCRAFWPFRAQMGDQEIQSNPIRSIQVATQMLGGLGNQLFQYAAGRALAQRLGARLVLDCTVISNAARRFVLDRYPIDADIVRDVPGKLHRRYFRLPGTLGRRLTDAFHDHVPTTHQIGEHRFKVFGEKRWFTYDPFFEKLAGSIYLTGYWQSYRYFEDAAETIRGEIRPPWAPSDANRAWLARIEAANAVCLHVRRGDYLDHQGEAPLVCAPRYYEQSVAHIRRSLPEPQFFVFSDDIAWCRETFADAGFAFVDSNGADDAADDLRLMAACRHHIIANSSLSWWGAWLARQPEQVVIAPQPWLPGVTSDRDLLPAQWIRLPRA
jgi:Glycosyl transferase family 11